jgi:hypothetical protein
LHEAITAKPADRDIAKPATDRSGR